MEIQRYPQVVHEFDLLLTYGRSIDVALTGSTPPSERHTYVGEIFIKLLAHCVTLRSISPDPNVEEKRLWDLASLAAISRCVIETYDSLSYIAAVGSSEDVRVFRIALWALHDSNRRIQMLQHVGCFDERLHELAAREQRLHEKVVAHSQFLRLPKNLQMKVFQRDPPESTLSIKERCAESGVSHDYYTAATIHLSQFVHTFPFSVHQLFEFRAGSAQALQLMGLPIQYAMGFLSKATEIMESVFPNSIPPPEAETHRKLQLWRLLLERGTKSAT